MTLKNTLSTLLTSLLIFVGKLQAQTVSFNFSLSPQPISGWVNVYGAPANAVRTATSGGITISSVAVGNWVPLPAGQSAADGGGAYNGTFFTNNVMINHWFQAGPLAAYNALTPQLELSGLNKDTVYTVKMTGSFTLNIGSLYELNPIRYTVAGAMVYGYIDVNGDYNTSDGAVFHNIAPDANGVIKVYVNTAGAANIASISGIQITPERTTGPVPIVTLNYPFNNSLIPEDQNVTINASATEPGGTIRSVEFYIDSTKIGADSTAPYSMVWHAGDPGNFQVKVRATDLLGNVTTATANVTVESLNYFWSTTGNIATGGDSNFVGTVDTNRLAFRTNNIERMTISKDGGVAIGTDTVPTGYLLAVKGSGLFTHLQVKSVANWPDYVFEKKYQLRTLEDLAAYIERYKHLPDVASVAKVNAEGVDLGANQAAILRNVEELTLHLIEENRLMRSQTGKTAELEKKVADQEKKVAEKDRQIKDQNARFAELQRQIDALKGMLNKTNN